MEFLKALFPDGGTLTYDQLIDKIKEQKLNVVNLAEGGYVSKNKFDDETKRLSGQVTDLQGQLTQRDTDMEGLKSSLAAAQADAGKLADVQKSFTDLQAKYTAEKGDFEKKISQQSYEFAVKEKANSLEFSSVAARKAFVQEAIGKEFKLDGETLLGYDDFVAKYKADDPGAFKAAPADPNPEGGQNTPPPAVVLPSGSGASGTAPDVGGFNFAFNGVRPRPKE
jgi:outer membrane murein-binding lipoprotein Lpp